MNFSLERSMEILERTPSVLKEMTAGLDPAWTHVNEGGDTWSVFDVVGHLIHGEKTDWIIRMRIILSDQENKYFAPFDRFAQFEASKGKTLKTLLEEFAELRAKNLAEIKSRQLTEMDFSKTGIHPAFGTVRLDQLLSTWVVHDLDHISQMARVMAKQYTEATGPWIEYLKILRQA